MAEQWTSVPVGEVQVGDRIRHVSGAVLTVSRIEPTFLGRPGMVATKTPSFGCAEKHDARAHTTHRRPNSAGHVGHAREHHDSHRFASHFYVGDAPVREDGVRGPHEGNEAQVQPDRVVGNRVILVEFQEYPQVRDHRGFDIAKADAKDNQEQ